jgi:hypothetical protein
MANTELVRLPPDASPSRIVAAINALIDVNLGNLGAQVKMIGHDGTSTDPNLNTSTGTGLYQAEIASAGANHLKVGADKLTVTDTVTTAAALTVTGATTGNGALQFKTTVSAQASASLALTTSFQDVAGCSVSLTPGVWLVNGIFYFLEPGAGDVGQILVGGLATTGGAATVALSNARAVFVVPSALSGATAAQAWRVTVTATTTAKLQALKTGGAGTGSVQVQNTTITATNA